MKKPHSALYGITDKEIARICRVSLKTAQRWKKGQIVPSYCEIAMLERDIGCFAAQWRGWTIRGEELLSPEGWAITRNDVLASPLLRQQLAVYQAELRRIREEADALEEQPAPSDWDVQITA